MIVPELGVTDIEKSIDFYVNILGFSIKYNRPENKFAYVVMEDNEIMIEQCNGEWSVGELSAPFGRGINFEIGISDIDPILSSLKENGIKLFREPFDSSYGGDDGKVYTVKEFLVQDPDGYLLRFSQEISYG